MSTIRIGELKKEEAMKKAIIFLIVGLIFIFALAYNAAGQNIGSAAPQFTLKDIDGKNVNLNDYKDKVIILDFWATWCPPCRKEIPDFIALQNEYGKKGLQIIGIAVDRGGIKSVKPFYKKMGINYQVLISDGKVDLKYGGIQAIPTTFVIDKNGKIVKKYVGFQPKATFEKEIKGLLSK